MIVTRNRERPMLPPLDHTGRLVALRTSIGLCSVWFGLALLGFLGTFAPSQAFAHAATLVAMIIFAVGAIGSAIAHAVINSRS